MLPRVGRQGSQLDQGLPHARPGAHQAEEQGVALSGQLARDHEAREEQPRRAIDACGPAFERSEFEALDPSLGPPRRDDPQPRERGLRRPHRKDVSEIQELTNAAADVALPWGRMERLQGAGFGRHSPKKAQIGARGWARWIWGEPAVGSLRVGVDLGVRDEDSVGLERGPQHVFRGAIEAISRHRWAECHEGEPRSRSMARNRIAVPDIESQHRIARAPPLQSICALFVKPGSGERAAIAPKATRAQKKRPPPTPEPLLSSPPLPSPLSTHRSPRLPAYLPAPLTVPAPSTAAAGASAVFDRAIPSAMAPERISNSFTSAR